MNLPEDTIDIDHKQVATNAMSAAARLDRPTEDRLYDLYRAFFRVAENDRRWNLWNDVPWSEVSAPPSPALTAAVLDAFREDLLLPDYAARSLHVLRSSRGRAWFLTRWSYEEGKHLLALQEWLIRSGSYSDNELRSMSDSLLATYRWEPPASDGAAVFVDMLLWEMREIERFRALLAQAAGDAALTSALGYILRDEEAHREFFRAALTIIGERYPELVADAAARMAEGADAVVLADLLAR